MYVCKYVYTCVGVWVCIKCSVPKKKIKQGTAEVVLLFFEALLSRTTCTYDCLHTWEGSGTNTEGATLPLSLAFVVLPAPLFLSTPSDFRWCVSASTRSGQRAV